MRNATRILTSTMGTFVALAGIEHGIGEILQGNRPPAGIIFPSWPESPFFDIMGGEPAMSVIPNLLLTGILTVLVSLAFLVWAIRFVQRRNGGAVLILLSIVMLLVGGGIFPPVFGVITGLIGTRINAPLAWWRTHLSDGLRSLLGKLWPWSLGACVVAWLSMVPGLNLLNAFFGFYNPDVILILLLCMFGFLGSTCVAGFARDIQMRGSESHLG